MSTSDHETKPVTERVLTGWDAIESVVRGLDEEKIHGYKEDIDTLLVFTGLFSAATAALLVESYSYLTEDPGTIQVALLQNIYTQSVGYTSSAAFLNTSEPSPVDSTSHFEPSWLFVRVNALWLVSVALSLTAASLGMSVKQWLQAYLAADFGTSPRRRLRVRRYRKVGFESWHVCDIAAALPALLQLALGLFFVGLCMFTWALCIDIGRASASLIAAWGVYCGFTLIAPMFFPRCPYKTNVLATMSWALRANWRAFNRGVLKRIMKNSSNSYVLKRYSRYQRSQLQEREAAWDASGDMKLLASLDTELNDDRFLDDLWQAFQQIDLEGDPRTALDFLLDALRRCLPDDITGQPLSYLQIMDLRPLSKDAFFSVTQLASGILLGGLEILDRTTKWEDWMSEPFAVLLAQHEFPLPLEASEALKKCLNGRPRDHVRRTILSLCQRSGTNELNTFNHVLNRLRPSFLCLSQDNVKSMVEAVHNLTRGRMCEDVKCYQSHIRLPDIMWTHRSFPSEDVRSTMTSTFLDQLHRPGLVTEDVYVWETVRAILSWPAPKSLDGSISGLIDGWLGRRQTFYGILTQTCSQRQHRRAYGPFATELMCSLYRDATIMERRGYLDVFQRIVREYVARAYDDRSRFSRLNYVRVCLLCARIFKEQQSFQISECLLEEWRVVWEGTASAMRREQSWEQDHDPAECHDLALKVLDVLNDIVAAYPGSEHGGHELEAPKVLFPEQLVTTLVTLVPRREELLRFDRIAHFLR